MKRKTITIQDPDFGPIELPDEPAPTQREWNVLRRRIRQRILNQQMYLQGQRYGCDRCGKRSVSAVTDVTQEIIRGDALMVVANLPGARCSSCGAEYLEPRASLVVDDLMEGVAGPEEHLRITRVGRGTLGTYWSKGLERRLDLRPGDQLKIRVTGRSSGLFLVTREGRRNTGINKTRTRRRAIQAKG